jgi:hypothetical protein
MAHTNTVNSNANPANHLEPKAAHSNNGGYAAGNDSELGQSTTAHSGQALLQGGGQPIGRQISVTLSRL